MSAFEFLFSLFGLLLGLSIAELAGGFSRLYDQRKVRPIGWLAPGLAAVLLLDLLTFWYGAWFFRRLELNFWLVLGAGIVGLLYYFAATQVFPREGSTVAGSDHVMEHRRPVVVVVIIANIIMFGPSFVLNATRSGLGALDLIPASANLIYFALLGVMGFSPSRRWAGLAMVASPLLILGSVAVMGY